jgi:nitrogen fixation protein
MDSIEKLLKTGRPTPQPEHSFQIIFQDSEPSKESLVMSDDNKPIFIDPLKYPSPHMIIYEPVIDYRELEKFGGKCVKLGNGGTTFDPCLEISKLPDDEKDKLTAEAIKIIEKREEERKLE